MTCDTNKFDTNGDATDGCEAGCAAVTDGTCSACTTALASGCTAVTCDTNKFDTNGNAADGCEAGCATVTNANSVTCTGPNSADIQTVSCNAGYVQTGSAGSLACAACSNGQWSNVGATTCQMCQHSISNANSVTCTSPNGGSPQLVSCMTGYYVNGQAGQLTPATCSANEKCNNINGFGTDFTCGPGFSKNSDLTNTCAGATCQSSDCCNANEKCNNINGSGAEFTCGPGFSKNSDLTNRCYGATCQSSDCCTAAAGYVVNTALTNGQPLSTSTACASSGEFSTGGDAFTSFSTGGATLSCTAHTTTCGIDTDMTSNGITVRRTGLTGGSTTADITCSDCNGDYYAPGPGDDCTGHSTATCGTDTGHIANANGITIYRTKTAATKTSDMKCSDCSGNFYALDFGDCVAQLATGAACTNNVMCQSLHCHGQVCS